MEPSGSPFIVCRGVKSLKLAIRLGKLGRSRLPFKSASNRFKRLQGFAMSLSL